MEILFLKFFNESWDKYRIKKYIILVLSGWINRKIEFIIFFWDINFNDNILEDVRKI